MSVKDHDSRWLEVWRNGGLNPEGVMLPMETEAKAITLRHRLYRLRASMHREKHPYSEAASKAKIRVVQLEQPLSGMLWALHIIPADAEYEDTLAKAGFRVPEAPDLG